jgi:hypothetical protein
MSFYDDASLVFLPSGGAGKDTKAYSIKPTDGSGDFTFSRGSNLTATRVDSNGLIEKGRENLLLQSNQFDTTWVTNNASVTSGQTGYDGSNDAWKLTATGNNNDKIRQDTTTTGVKTFSVYAKAGNVNFVLLEYKGYAYFNLDTGAVGARNNEIDSNIEYVGSDWYRCSITANITTSGIDAQIYVASANGSISTSNGDNIYIQDAQVEQGLVATEYIESGATTGLAGLLEDSPRFDYSGGASCPSLLLEPSRTNLIGYSEYLGGTGWTAQAGITLTPNTTETLSPEGLNNAYKVVSTDATKGFYISGLNVTNDAVRTIYLKGSVGGETIVFKDPGGFGTPSTKTLTTDWQRFEMATTNDGNTYQGLFIDDISVGTIYAYGAQMEEGSYSSSYIPNHSGGSETRNADECTKTTISGLIGQTEGTIYCEFEYNGAADSGVFNRIIGLGTGVTQNRILLAKNDTTAELVAFAVTGGTTQVFQAIAGTSIIGHHKVAISYKANEYKVYLDGELEFTDTSASVPATTDVYIGTAEDGTTNNELGGIVKQSIIFKEVLSVDNCKALTTL